MRSSRCPNGARAIWAPVWLLHEVKVPGTKFDERERRQVRRVAAADTLRPNSPAVCTGSAPKRNLPKQDDRFGRLMSRGAGNTVRGLHEITKKKSCQSLQFCNACP